jgi:predicted Zn-dependent protease
MVFGDDPRDGYFDESRFHHPALEFRLDFPAGWKTVNGREAVAATSPERDAVVILSRASEPTAEQALQKFLAQEGVTSGSSWRSRAGDYPVASRGFRAATSQGNVSGIAVFLRHGEATYRLLGYAAETAWSVRSGTIEPALSSFARETDPAVLRVEPARLKIVENRSAVSVSRFAQLHDASVPPETLALINHVAPDATLESGRRYKVVVGGRTP